jgi:hypothetical protein
MDDVPDNIYQYTGLYQGRPKSIRSTKTAKKPQSKLVGNLVKAYLSASNRDDELIYADPLKTLDDLCRQGMTTYNKICLLALKLSKYESYLNRLRTLFDRSDMTVLRFRRMVFRMLLDLDYSIWAVVFQNFQSHLGGDEYLLALTQTIVHDRFDIFMDLNPKTIIDVSVRTDLISRAYYAGRHKFCAELIKDLSESDLIIIRSQIPDIDIVMDSDSGTMVDIEASIRSSRTALDLQTVYTIHQSLGSRDIDSDLAYEIFVNSLEFNDLTFTRQVYDKHSKYINPKLYELYVNLIYSNDQIRLPNLLKQEFEVLRLTTIFDFKEGGTLTNLQSASFHKTVIDTSIDRGIIDRTWLLKMYRFYHQAIGSSLLDSPEKLVVLSEYLNIPMESRILRAVSRAKRSDLSIKTYNGLVLYHILRSAEQVGEELILYFINTHKINVRIYNGLLLRTAVKMNRSDILHLLS